MGNETRDTQENGKEFCLRFDYESLVLLILFFLSVEYTLVALSMLAVGVWMRNASMEQHFVVFSRAIIRFDSLLYGYSICSSQANAWLWIRK